jgi:Domain of unknown function (DUF397)
MNYGPASQPDQESAATAGLRSGKAATRDLSPLAGISWVKSSHSFGNGDCVEAAHLPGGDVALRDSKDKAGPVLLFDPGEWRAFLGGVKGGEFDFVA